MACHGRAELTRQSVKALKEFLPPEIAQNAHLYLVDDRCPEGSAQIARETWGGNSTLMRTRHPQFWARSMSLAETAASLCDHDYLVWVNQDTVATAPLNKLFDPERIVVGTCLIDGVVSKGALVSDGWNCKFRVAKDGETPDTFNGNLVVIPRKIFTKLTITGYRHAFADLAYGLRATAAGEQIAKGPICARTEQQTGNWRDKGKISERWDACLSPTGLPVEDWWAFCREFGGARGRSLLGFALAYRYLLKKRKQPRPVVAPLAPSKSDPMPEHKNNQSPLRTKRQARAMLAFFRRTQQAAETMISSWPQTKEDLLRDAADWDKKDLKECLALIEKTESSLKKLKRAGDQIEQAPKTVAEALETAIAGGWGKTPKEGLPAYLGALSAYPFLYEACNDLIECTAPMMAGKPKEAIRLGRVALEKWAGPETPPAKTNH